MESSALVVIAVLFMLWLYFVLPVNMAQDRNRSPVVWVILTLVLSPWILLILFVIGNAPEEGRN